MATDYGTDVSCTTDLDPLFSVVSGTTAVAQALARRLQTPAGGLIGDPDYGYDLRAWVNRPLGQRELFELRQAVVAEVLKDERVASAEVTVARTGSSLTVDVAVILLEGETFSLVLAVTAVTVAVLQGG